MLQKTTLLFAIITFFIQAQELKYKEIFGNRLFVPTQELNDTIYFENFTSGLNGWTAESLDSVPGITDWHLNNSTFVSGPFSVNSADSLIRRNADGKTTAIVSPVIQIPSGSDGYKLQFSVKWDFPLPPSGSSNYSFWRIQVSTNFGLSWIGLSDYAFVGETDWTIYPDGFNGIESGDLTQFAGQEIRIRFVSFQPLNSITGKGLFLDDIMVAKSGCPPDMYEPNDFFAQAVPIELNTPVSGSICPETDNDYYRISVNPGTTIRVITNLNPRLGYALFKSDSVLVGNNLYNTTISYYTTTGGIFYIGVNRGQNQTFPANYTFSVSILDPNPNVLSVEDIPADQGGQVRVTWAASIYDPPTGTTAIQNYFLWRKVNPLENSGDKEIIPISIMGEILLRNGTSGLQNIIVADSGSFWDYITSVPAVTGRPFTDYAYVAPTLADSQLTTFIVSARSINGQFYWGVPGSGYSFDNLAPEFLNYSAVPGQQGINLSWNINRIIHHDLVKIRVYRGNYSGFMPLENTMLGELPAGVNGHTDLIAKTGVNYFYRLAALDRSGHSVLTPEISASLTSVRDSDLPSQYRLDQNYPNPFNPSTRITFAVPKEDYVKIVIYNLIGEIVAVPFSRNVKPGNYSVDFNGSGLNSGIYFYELQADGFSSKRKFTLLK